MTQRYVDVVVDVPTAAIEGAFTYRLDVNDDPIGVRVRVPFAGRTAAGWVVGERTAAPPGVAVLDAQAIAGGERHFSQRDVDLASWIARRYACSLREALSLVAARAAPAARSRYAFVTPPDPADADAAELYRRFATRPFTALAAARALRTRHGRSALAMVNRSVDRWIRAGALTRGQSTVADVARSAPQSRIAILADASKAKTAAQRRLVAALSEHGELLLADAARRAGVGTSVILRAAAAGIVRLEHRASQAPGPAVGLQGGFAALSPTPAQAAAIQRIGARLGGPPSVTLLHGVTGSGKTLVYAGVMERVRAAGGRAIVLVPEIALTPQTAGRFAAAFGKRVAVLHSALREGQRRAVLAAAAAGDYDVVVGARSAVFAPLPQLRLIVVDEEHEASYKQDVAPRYDAVAVARERMAAAGGHVILGSATPRLETFDEAMRGAIALESLGSRATSVPMPPVEIIDMTAAAPLAGRSALGPDLVAAMSDALRAGGKVMLFLNRRGYAGFVLCRACGFAPRCKRCAVSLVVHTTDGSMRCHVCGAAYRVPARCPKCASNRLSPYGFGTQRVEEEVRDLFPGATIVRMDADTTGGVGAHASLLDEFAARGDVLVGTQMIAKGLDFPTVTLVGVVSADLDLHRPDFRAAERTFSLLTQVAGRAGRASAAGRVIVQTYAAQHYAVQLAARHDYIAFARAELELRKELRYPPFGRMAYVGVTAADEQRTTQAAHRLGELLRDRNAVPAHGLELLGPAPDPLPKARGEYRLRFALKATDEEPLLDAAAAARSARVGDARVWVDVDPR